MLDAPPLHRLNAPRPRLARAPQRESPGRVFVPDGQEGAALRQAGYETVAALGDTADPRAEARRLGCTHLLDGASVVEL